MSDENIAIARRAYEAFNRGDQQAMVADLAPNFEYATTGAIPGMTGVYRGVEGILGFLEWMRSEFERPRIEAHELVDAGDEVVAGVTLRGRGKQSGVGGELGRLARLDHGARQGRSRAGIYEQGEALEAAGLSGVGVTWATDPLSRLGGFLLGSLPARDTAWAMSSAGSEFLQAFRESFEQGTRAWNAGDIKVAYAALPDQLEYRLAPTWPEARVLRSRDEVIDFFESFLETFPDARTASHQFLEGNHGAVVVGFRVTGTGRTSGAEAEMEIWQVWEVRDQDALAVAGVTEFTDRREALEAAGLRE